MDKLIPHSKPTIREEEVKSALKCMISDYIAPGNLVKEFELNLGNYLGTPYVKALSSGTLAFYTILKLLGIKKDDEIILSSYLPHILLNPIHYLEAKPVLVDIEEKGFAPRMSEIRKKITPNTKAILITHLFGIPIEIDEYKEFGVPIIENAAQALGATFGEQKCGTMGDYAFFSFYASKMISTGGMGGAIALKDPSLYEKLGYLISREDRTDYQTSYPFLLSDVQAAMGISQLKNLDTFVDKRKQIASYYSVELKKAGKVTPDEYMDRTPCFFRYLIQSSLPIEESLGFFKKYNIEAKRPIFKPLHRYLGLDHKQFPQTEKAFYETVSLPIYPTLKKTEADNVLKVACKI
jgi:dTDP-4-amino-4,6-dideoxygalactose transaminase